jgi:cobalt-zinc-cadmium efflux system outer membrane protein
MILKSLLGLVAFVCFQQAWAEMGPSAECTGLISSYKELLQCAEERSPEVAKARLELERAKTQVGVAGQWRNPELSVSTLHGESASEADLALGVPIELGGKISARLRVAESGVAKAELALFEVRANIRHALLLKLHRLRQLFHEQEVVDESIGTFSKLVAQYAARPKLSPEQEISVSVFRMSKSEYDLKMAELNDELSSISVFIKAHLGLSVEKVKSMLPPVPNSWPNVEKGINQSSSIRLKQTEAEVRAAESELALAKSEAWPTLVLGPTFKLQTEGGRSDRFYGVNLSLPLPLFNTNGAGQEAGKATVALAKAGRGYAVDELERRRDELVQIYERSVKILNLTISHQDIEKKHADVERLFFKGVVPSSLVIEAHRTFTELEKSRNERELRALEALFSIYVLDGKTPEF